jgi:hypothetical protein
MPKATLLSTLVPRDNVLLGWFYRLEGLFEFEQAQRLYQFLISPESSLKFANQSEIAVSAVTPT